MRFALTIGAAVAAAATLAAPAHAADPRVAAVQVALRARGLYGGDVDGLEGPATDRAIRRFQRRARLVVDGVAGPRTRRALGRLGRPALGRRVLARGLVGGDVAELQFALATHGFAPGIFDGVFGRRTEAALRGFQRRARLVPDGRAGPATVGALAGPRPVSPLRVGPPLRTAPTDGFGPRGARFHTGIDYPAPSGTHVHAARSGRVTFAGWYGGYGYVVSLAHGAGVRTLYAHLSAIRVRLGERVRRGEAVGAVGSTGASTGPHLHFEVRVRGAAVDPLSALGG